MGIEQGVQQPEVKDMPPASFSLKSTSEIPQIPTIRDLAKEVLDILDSDIEFVAWAGKNWRIEGLKSTTLQRPVFKNKDISYFGSVPQGGPALFLKIRKPGGEGFLFQIGNPDSQSEAGKKDIHTYWDEKGNVSNLSLMEKVAKTRSFFENLRPRPLPLVS